MTQAGAIALIGTAATVGVIHTLLGPDHYVPFIAMSRAGRWSVRKTMGVTLICGLAHVLSSVVLGIAGIAAGSALGLLSKIETARGEIAGWLLLGFGLAYTIWGLRRAIRNQPHTHVHAHADGTVHSHVHVHGDEHAHVHVQSPRNAAAHVNQPAHAVAAHVGEPACATAAHLGEPADAADSPRSALTGWALFTIFIFGPCEPLIPLMLAPAAVGRWWVVALVSAMFSAATLGVMTGLVYAGIRGARRWSAPGLERFAHAGAGLALTACGLTVKLGL